VFKKEESSASVVKVLMEGDVEMSAISPSRKRSSKRVAVESSAVTDEDEKHEKTESAFIPRKQTD